MSTLAAAVPYATDQHRNWNGLIALAVAGLLFYFVVIPLGKWVRSKTSPTPLSIGSGSRPKVQATVGVDTGDTKVDTYDWGRIGYERRAQIKAVPAAKAGFRERLRLLIEHARQIAATGSHELPAPPGPGEDDVDLALEEPAPRRPAEAATEVVARRQVPMEEYIGNALNVAPYSHIVKVCMDNYGVSESTAKRRIRELREQRGDTAA